MSIGVLVVEDEALIRLNVVTFLEEEGFDVAEAENADRAIDVLTARDDIRLLFTDIDMPGALDGLKLSAYVANRWPPMRIIVTSGKRLVEASEMPDGSVFFAKPYRIEDVVRSIRKLVH